MVNLKCKYKSRWRNVNCFSQVSHMAWDVMRGIKNYIHSNNVPNPKVIKVLGIFPHIVAVIV